MYRISSQTVKTGLREPSEEAIVQVATFYFPCYDLGKMRVAKDPIQRDGSRARYSLTVFVDMHS